MLPAEKNFDGLENFKSLSQNEQDVLQNLTIGVATYTSAYVSVFGPKDNGSSRHSAHAFFQRPAIQAALRELQAAQRHHYATLRDQIIQQLIGDVSYDLSEAFDEHGIMLPVPKMPENLRKRITKYSQGRYGDRVEFVDKQKSMSMLLDLLGIGQSSPGMTVNINLGDQSQAPMVDVTPAALQTAQGGVQLDLDEDTPA